MRSDLVSETEMAAEFGEHPKTWAKRRRHRTGPAFITIGRSTYYRRQDIDNWLERKLVDPLQAPASRSRKRKL